MLFTFRFILWALILLAAFPVKGQVYQENTDLYTTRSGLPNNSIISLYQDSKGYLWIGTYNGLCRYDGHEFKTYKHELTSRADWVFSVSTICEDADGNILIGTRGGILAKMNRKNEKWEYLHLKADITGAIINKAGKEFITTRNGYLGVVFPDSIGIIKDIGKQVRSLSLYSQEELLLVSDHILLYNFTTNEIKNISPLLKKPVDAVSTYGSYTYFFHNDNSVTVKIRGLQAYSRFILPGELNFNVMRDPVGVIRNGNLIIITPSGLFEISKEGEIISRVEIGQHSNTLNRNFVNNIFEDNSGIIWIGTNAGLIKIDKKKFAFKNLASNIPGMTIKHNYVRSLLTYENALWIGTRFGEIGKLEMDEKTGKPMAQTWYGLTSATGEIDRNYTTNALTSDHNGNIWAAGSRGLYVLKKGYKNYRIVNYSPKNVQHPLPDIWALGFVNEEKLLIGTVNAGLFQYNIKTNILERCRGQAEDISVWNVFISTEGKVWVGTSHGLFLYDEDTEEIRLYTAEGSDGQLYEEIWSINEDKFNNIWFGTTNNGIFCIEKATNKLRHYNEKDGLSDNVTSGIVPDLEGNIWISTINGLSKLDINEQKFYNYNEEDGLISNDFNFKSYTRNTGGQIFYGTKVGIVAFNPAEVVSAGVPKANTEITSFKVEGVEQPIADKVKLHHNSNNISFRFALLDFGKPAAHTYRYRLDGFEKVWQYTSADYPSATYTNLPPGDYKFTVQASVDEKQWSTNTSQMYIHIQPAIWQRPGTWFGTGLIMLFASVVVVRRRFKFLINREREKAKVQKAMGELEMKALRAQMNPHFIFNAVTAIQHYIVKSDILLANEYLSKFAKLMRAFLELSRFKYVSLAKEVELLELYISLEKLRFDERFDYTVEVDEKVNTQSILIPSMLLQPFVENAINHGLMHKKDKGYLRLFFGLRDNDKSLYCVIEDNGVGRQHASAKNGSRRHMSLGTKIVEERVKSFLDSEDLKITVQV